MGNVASNIFSVGGDLPKRTSSRLFAKADEYNQEPTIEEKLKILLDDAVNCENPSPVKVHLILEALGDIEGDRTLKSMRDTIEEHSKSTGISFENLEDNLTRMEKEVAYSKY